MISNLYIFYDFRGLYNVFMVYMAETTMLRRFRGRRHISVRDVDFRDFHAYDRESMFVFSRHIHVDEYIVCFGVSK
jgi:hypothetical protein